MPQALWTLLALHFRGVFRRMLRGVRTPRGLAFLVLGILVITSWLGPTIYRAVKMPRTDPDVVRTVAPFAILGFCLGNLVASFGENAVAFTGAEVDFLFPGPFSRRSLLAFKIIKSALGTIFTSLFFLVMLLRFSGSWFACTIGVWLTIQFMQLFAMAIVMIGQTVGERIYSAARRGVLLTALGAIVVIVAPRFAAMMNHGPVELMAQVHATLAGRILLAPFDVFAHTFTARTLFPDLVKWGGLALLIDVFMLAVVIGLDANYLETAAAVSQRRYDRLHRARRGGIGMMTARSTAGLHVRPLPWLAGAGPVAWRQLVGALRSSRGLLLLLAIIAVSASTVILSHHGNRASALGPVIGTGIWINLLFVTMLRFDFRDELDRMDLLRSLPIRPAAIAAAELITPVLVLTIMQGLLLIAMGIARMMPLPFIFAAAAFTVPFNLLLAGIENLLFLMFPLRAAGLIAGDMQLFGRQMVVFFCKFLLLITGLVVASAFGLVGYILGNKSWPAFGAVAWVALCFVAIGMIPLLARAYSRFDPSVDTPL
jgi:ABC-2 type transport system permease protein